MTRMVFINYMVNKYLTNLTLNSMFEIILSPPNALKFLILKAFLFFMFTSIFSFYKISLSSIEFSNLVMMVVRPLNCNMNISILIISLFNGIPINITIMASLVTHWIARLRLKLNLKLGLEEEFGR